MGLFDRSSSTTNLTEQNFQEIQNETIGVENVSGINLAGVGGDVELHIDQVDSGVVAASAELGSQALTVAGDIAASAMRASRDAYDFARDVNDDSLREVGNVAGRSITATEGIASDSIRAQNDITAYALGQQSNVTRDALESGGDIARDAISANSNIIRDFIDSVFGFGETAIGAQSALARDTGAATFRFTGDVVDAQSSLAQESVRAQTSVLGDAFAFGRSAIESTQETLASTVDKTIETLSGAIGSAASATRSDASDVLNNITKFGAIAIGLVAVAFVVSRR